MRWNSDYKNCNKPFWLNILIGIVCCGTFDGTFAVELSNILPCDYADSMNITNGHLLPNNNYIFNGVEYPDGHYARINYTISEKKIVPQHPYIRGCVCNVKDCIRFCCPYGSYLEMKNGGGFCRHHDVAKHIDGEIINQNNETQRIKYHEHFAILHRYPCENILRMPNEEQYSITHVSTSSFHRTSLIKWRLY